MAKIEVKGTSITVYTEGDKDFISLTDMIRAKDGDFFISDWLRNRNTVEFLGIWEQVHNPNFNYGGFAIIKSQAGLNNYKLSVKEWVAQTNAIGLVAKAGRYGGTYAHQDIAFEFGMWTAGNTCRVHRAATRRRSTAPNRWCISVRFKTCWDAMQRATSSLATSGCTR
ncbi:MAG: hypothetical protein JWP93_363 [Polaromonas sp.]|nr:hypothetical protein [Polaromonas sp.]